MRARKGLAPAETFWSRVGGRTLFRFLSLDLLWGLVRRLLRGLLRLLVLSNGLQKSYRIENCQVRVVSAEMLIGHQVEKVPVSTYQVVRSGGNCQVQIGLILRIPFQGENLGNLAEQECLALDVLHEGFDPFLRQQWESLLRLRPGQYIANLGQDLGADAKCHLILINEPQTRPGRTSGPSCPLQKDHAIKDNARLHCLVPCFSCRTSSRTSSKKRSNSASVIPAASTASANGAQISSKVRPLAIFSCTACRTKA